MVNLLGTVWGWDYGLIRCILQNIENTLLSISRKRNHVALSGSFLGPFCFWIWRLFLILIITFCVVNFIFLLGIIVDKKIKRFREPPGMVNAKLEEIIQEKVYGAKPLYKIPSETRRNKILIITYSARSSLVSEIATNSDIFQFNVGRKLMLNQINESQIVIASLNFIR